MNANFSRWTSPILGKSAEKVYSEVYGDLGDGFIHILENSPYEIAVISRMVAYLNRKKERR